MTTTSVGAAEPVRWGVLGAANIAVKALLPAIRQSANGRVVAIASRDGARAQHVAEQYPGARAFDSYDALLEDADVEAVYIPLPNALHAEWTERAAAAGKHVLCEKPFGTTAGEVRRMIEVCRQAGVLLMEAFMYRFHPQVQWALDQLAEGVIGDIRLVRSAFAFDIRNRPADIRLKAALAGGSLMDVGCYPLNFALAVFDLARPAAIAARVDVPPASEVERTLAAVLDFGAGRMAIIDSSFEQPWHQSVEVVGESGRLMLERPFQPGRQETFVRIERGDETRERRFAPVDQYQLEVEHFGACVRAGTAPALSTEGSLRQAEVVEAIYQAAGYHWPR